MDKDDEIQVFNPTTQLFVPFRVDKVTKEIIIVSTNPRDNDDTCIVTTWKNVHLLYKRKANGEKRF